MDMVDMDMVDMVDMVNMVDMVDMKPDSDEDKQVGSDPGKANANKKKPGNVLHPENHTFGIF